MQEVRVHKSTSHKLGASKTFSMHFRRGYVIDRNSQCIKSSTSSKSLGSPLATGLQVPKEEGLPDDVVGRLKSYETVKDVPFKVGLPLHLVLDLKPGQAKHYTKTLANRDCSQSDGILH